MTSAITSAKAVDTPSWGRTFRTGIVDDFNINAFRHPDDFTFTSNVGVTTLKRGGLSNNSVHMLNFTIGTVFLMIVSFGIIVGGEADPAASAAQGLVSLVFFLMLPRTASAVVRNTRPRNGMGLLGRQDEPVSVPGALVSDFQRTARNLASLADLSTANHDLLVRFENAIADANKPVAKADEPELHQRVRDRLDEIDRAALRATH